MIEAAQIRAARALLDLSQIDLAQSAGVSVATVRRVEATNEVRGAAETLWKLEMALKRLGVEFISAESGRGPGVRLSKASKVGNR